MMYVFIAAFAAFMWGSWMQVTKHLKKYPLPAFMYLLYLFSFLIVLTLALIYERIYMNTTIWAEISSNWNLTLILLICGALFSNGMFIQLNYMNKIGMVLVTSISSAFTTILGIIVTVVVGGLPENFSIAYIIISMVCMLLAGFICQYAGIMRDKDLKVYTKVSVGSYRYILIILFGNILQTAYVYGYSIGTKSLVSSTGFDPLIVVTILALGSFIGINLSSLPILKKMNYKFKNIFVNPKALLISFISGFAHYGGNVLNVVATAYISAPVSFLIGKTADFWTYMWGLFYGEFKGSSVKTMVTLFSGFGIYLVGVLMLLYGIYYV